MRCVVTSSGYGGQFVIITDAGPHLLIAETILMGILSESKTTGLHGQVLEDSHRIARAGP